MAPGAEAELVFEGFTVEVPFRPPGEPEGVLVEVEFFGAVQYTRCDVAESLVAWRASTPPNARRRSCASPALCLAASRCILSTVLPRAWDGRGRTAALERMACQWANSRKRVRGRMVCIVVPPGGRGDEVLKDVSGCPGTAADAGQRERCYVGNCLRRQQTPKVMWPRPGVFNAASAFTMAHGEVFSGPVRYLARRSECRAP